MEESPRKPYILVPEHQLLENLPDHQRKRFEVALEAMHSNWFTHLGWQEIADIAAISPYHFHRQFTELFCETPGAYLSRVRLQMAATYLLENSDKKITDIALDCGFSSSQALAKALKRELHVTAKQIRTLGMQGSIHAIRQLFAPLAHHAGIDGAALETEMAAKIPCKIESYPTRAITLQTLPKVDWETMCEMLGEDIKQLTMLTPMQALQEKWFDDLYWVGKLTEPSGSNNEKQIPAGEYITAEVYIVSSVGYIAALDGIEQQAIAMGYQPDWKSICVEQALEVDWSATGGLILRVEAPVLRVFPLAK